MPIYGSTHKFPSENDTVNDTQGNSLYPDATREAGLVLSSHPKSTHRHHTQ